MHVFFHELNKLETLEQRISIVNIASLIAAKTPQTILRVKNPQIYRMKKTCVFCGQHCDSSFKAKNGLIHIGFSKGSLVKSTRQELQQQKRKRCPCSDSEIQAFIDQGMF